MNLSNALREGVIENEFLPRYASLVQAGIVYGAVYTTAAATVASATATGPFALFNPPTSGIQLVLLAATLGLVAFTTPGTTGFGIGFQFVPNQQPTSTSAGPVPQNCLVGSAAVSGAATFAAGTLVGAPTVPGYLNSAAYLDLGASDLTTVKDDISGAIIVAPNSGVDVVVTTATPGPSLRVSLLWAEVPLG